MRQQFCVQIVGWENPTEGIIEEYFLMAESMVAAIETATEKFQIETGKDINKYLVLAHLC